MATDGVLIGRSGLGATAQETDRNAEAQLMRRVRGRSQEAFADLYDRHIGGVFATALRASGDPGIAEEVVQDTFLALWNRVEQFDPARGALATWLGTIARNRAIDRLRSAGRHDRAAAFSSYGTGAADQRSVLDELMASGKPIAMAGPEPVPEGAALQRETRATVHEALGSLDPLERRVIELAYRDGLSQSEIAVVLGWPIGTVKTRTRRALLHLRGRFEADRTEVVLPARVAPRIGECPAPC
jgi:RNA polymerase sigma-70 factor (ECF subfamily)